MRKFLVRLRVADYGTCPREKHTIVAELTNNLGSQGTCIKCYNDILDEDVEVELLAVDFWLLKPLPLYTLSAHLVSHSLEALNLYAPEKL